MKYLNNATTKFILPMISTETMRSKQFIQEPYFRGSFIGDINNAKWDNNILIAYKFHPSPKYQQIEKLITTNPYYLNGEDKDFNTIGIVVFPFAIPKEHIEDFYLIQQGKYSEISNTLKLKILKFWDEKETSLLHSILFKTQEIKNFWIKNKKNPKNYCAEDEYWYIPDLESEYFDEEKYEESTY